MSDLVSRLTTPSRTNAQRNNSNNATPTASTGTSTSNGAVFRLPITNIVSSSSATSNDDSTTVPRSSSRRTNSSVPINGSGRSSVPQAGSHFQNIYLAQNTNSSNTAGTLYYPSFRSAALNHQQHQPSFPHLIQQAILFPSSSASGNGNQSSNTRSHLSILQAHHQSLQQQQQALHQQQRTNSSGNNPSIHPHFRAKVVCNLNCKHCTKVVCRRGMKAILLADANVELYSTDSPPKGVQLVEDDYTTANCRCKIRDLACMTCGNVIGYHVTQPCDTCLESCNNGHFWMFLSESVASQDRFHSEGDRQLLWAHLPLSDNDSDLVQDPYDFGCR